MKIETPDYESRNHMGTVEVREEEDGTVRVKGLAAIFNSRSVNLGGFREVIKPGAFTETDMSDVRGLFNHDSNFVLGRTKNGTLRVRQSPLGLEYEIDMPNTRTVADLVLEPIKRGDVDQSSFGFVVGAGNDEWEEDDEGVLIRTIHKFQRLFDVSPVTFPAYQDTHVAARSMGDFLKESERVRAEIEKRKDYGRKAQALLRRAELNRLRP
jgi:hypothetical protein